MPNVYFSRRELKLKARITLKSFFAPCLAAAAAVLLFTLVGYMVQSYIGGLVFPGMLSAAEYPIGTGIWKVSPALMSTLGLAPVAARGGIMAALNMAATGSVMVFVLSFSQIVPYLVTTAIIFVLSTPIRYGALSALWAVLRGQVAPPKNLFHWYLDLRLALKSVVTQLLLSLWEWLVPLACLVPGYGLMVFSAQADGSSAIWYAVLLLLMCGVFFGFFCATIFLPVRLLLARSPELSIRAAFAKGFGLLKGRRRAFFSLWLSFLPLNLLSMFTYNVLDLVLFPYQSMTAMLYLEMVETAPKPEAAP